MTSNNISIVDFNQIEQKVRTTYDSGANVHTTWTNSKLEISNADVSFTNPVPTSEPDAGGTAPIAGTGTANGNATGNNLFGILDTTGYQAIQVQVTNSGNGSTIQYLGSDDNTHWITVSGTAQVNVNSGGPPTTSTTATTGFWTAGTKYRYFQANVSNYTGTVNVTATYVLRKSPHLPESLFVNNNNTNPIPVVLTQANAIGSNTNPTPVTLSVANAVATNTNPIPVLQVANTPIHAVTVAANTTSQILIAPNTHRTGILIQNQGAGNVAIVPKGGSNTTAAFYTSGSMVLLVDASLEFDKAIQDGFNCITDTGTSNVAVWEF